MNWEKYNFKKVDINLKLGTIQRSFLYYNGDLIFTVDGVQCIFLLYWMTESNLSNSYIVTSYDKDLWDNVLEGKIPIINYYKDRESVFVIDVYKRDNIIVWEGDPNNLKEEYLPEEDVYW